MPNQGGSHEQHVKSGEQSHKNDPKKQGSQQQHQSDNRNQAQQGGGHRGGSGNFAEDRERASEAGRKGGQS
ncbi:KGG domain-containing protein [Pleomorphomonas carboxyditropha]|uniref:KGG domain-containing protein n=1 Tax=Pleomorphomonas carboxyditropha TaxID=2023338 RepID=UPI0026B3B188